MRDVHPSCLELIPESLAQRVAKTMGARDIDFESAAFNRAWRVRAADRKYAHDLLDPRMLERLIQPDAEGAMIRIEGGAVMTWQAGRAGLDGLAAGSGSSPRSLGASLTTCFANTPSGASPLAMESTCLTATSIGRSWAQAGPRPPVR
jgi:hypothetical protein